MSSMCSMPAETRMGSGLTPAADAERQHAAEVDWPADVAAGAESVVHDKRHLVFMRHGGEPLEVRHVVTWVANRLNINRLRAGVDDAAKIGRVVAVDKTRTDAQPRQRDFEEIVRPGAEIAGCCRILARRRGARRAPRCRRRRNWSAKSARCEIKVKRQRPFSAKSRRKNCPPQRQILSRRDQGALRLPSFQQSVDSLDLWRRR